MIKCTLTDGCPEGKECCCYECEKRDTCGDACNGLNALPNCEHVKMDESDALAMMQHKAADIITSITNLTVQKKAIEEQEKAARAVLADTMGKYGVKSFENEQVKFTYIAPTSRTTIDSAKLKKELPDIAEKYSKTSSVSATVKITVK